MMNNNNNTAIDNSTILPVQQTQEQVKLQEPQKEQENKVAANVGASGQPNKQTNLTKTSPAVVNNGSHAAVVGDQVPRDAKVVEAVLRSNGIDNFDPEVR